MAIYRGPGGSGDATNDSSSEVRLAVEARDAAIAAQVAAEAANTAAQVAKNNAETAETNAETAETNAETAETNAASSASAASTSATNAASSASTATTQASNASSSASAASSSASSASTSASTATTQATNAATSATNASNSATAAAASATSSAASYDAFDDRYLGAKSSNPTVDNDGNTLITGALYFNSVASETRVWTGSVWNPISASGSTVTSFNTRTGDVTLTSSDVTTALTYTPLAPSAIGTTVQAYDSDLAAFAAKTAPSGAVIGTTDTQTLTNKTISGASNTLSNIGNSSLTNSAITINGTSTSLGGSASVGTVTSVAGTAGTGISITGSPITSSGTLTITNTAPDQTVAIASGTGISVSGTYPSFTVTNTAPSSGGTVTSVSGTAPVVSSGGNTPAISMAAATTAVDGYLTSTDWNTFNSKYGSGSSPSFAGITDSGNLTFTGTGNRITGDFSNGTLANRVAFQTNTANTFTVVNTLPNGTSVSSGFNLFNNSDPTNAGRMILTMTSAEAALQSGITGTGTYLPLTMATGGSERLRIDTSGNVGIGISSPSAKLHSQQTSGSNAFQLNTTTNGAGMYWVPTNGYGVQQYSYGGLMLLGTSDSNSVVLQTNSTERMRITSAGGISFGSSGTAYGTTGQVLTSQGDAVPTWTTPTTGTVTSVTAGTGLSGGTITGSGTIAIDSTVTTLTGTQTLTNKTLTSPTLTTATTSGKFTFGGAIDETVFAVTGTTPALSPSNGTIQTWTLTGNSTPTQGTFTEGESMTLMINDGSAYTVTWTSVPITWVGGTAPTLATTGFTVIELWEVGTTIYGALVGNVA